MEFRRRHRIEDLTVEVKGKREKFIVPVAVKTSLDHAAGNDITTSSYMAFNSFVTLAD